MGSKYITIISIFTFTAMNIAVIPGSNCKYCIHLPAVTVLKVCDAATCTIPVPVLYNSPRPYFLAGGYLLNQLLLPG